MSVDDKDWLLCRVMPNKEFSVQSKIGDLGLLVYCPTRRKLTRPKNKHRSVLSVLPAYPGYLFVKYGENFDAKELSRIKGYFGLVKFGDYIAGLSDEDIASIQDIEVANLWDDMGVGDGDTVRVKSGPFEGYVGRVVKCEKSHIYVVLQDSDAEIQLPPFLLARVQA